MHVSLHLVSSIAILRILRSRLHYNVSVHILQSMVCDQSSALQNHYRLLKTRRTHQRSFIEKFLIVRRIKLEPSLLELRVKTIAFIIIRILDIRFFPPFFRRLKYYMIAIRQKAGRLVKWQIRTTFVKKTSLAPFDISGFTLRVSRVTTINLNLSVRNVTNVITDRIVMFVKRLF